MGLGTLYYKDWDLFDQVIISGNFWSKKGFNFTCKERTDPLLPIICFSPTRKASQGPNRTASKDYYGGYSDHLPVYIDLRIK